MKKFTTILFSIILGLSALAQEPVITATTTLPVGSSITFQIANKNNTPVQIDFGDGNKVSQTISNRTAITGTIKTSQNIKIYGADIEHFFCTGSQLTMLDVSKCITLSYLFCNDNLLTTLDLSANTELYFVKCYKNQLSSLNLSTNTILYSVECNDNKLSTLDLSSNNALTVLKCYNNNLTTLDVTKNTLLHTLSCETNLIKELDVTKNVALVILSCHYNQITKLDISKNPALEYLVCAYNQIKTLDITNNNALSFLNCDDNLLTFASLPLKKASLSSYYYAPQLPISISKQIYIETALDLSSEYSIGGNTTTYTWKTKMSGTTLVAGTDYTIVSGKTTFLKPQTDSVYCEMTNATFPSLSGANTLKTTNVKVKELDLALSMTTAKAPGSSVTFYLMVNASTNLQIDFGDGNKINKLLNTDYTTITGTVGNSQTIKIYGDGIFNFSCGWMDLTALDVNKCTSLKNLYCDGNKLTSLNVTNNTLLEELICSGSPLSTLDISKNTALTKLVCASNKLKQLDVSNNKALKIVSCGYNEMSFATLPVKQATWTEYYYEQQAPLSIAERIATGTVLDLSSQYSIAGNTTTFIWKTKSNIILEKGVDYTVANGKFTFLKPQTDNLICFLANATFPDLGINNLYYSTFIKVVGSQTITFNALPAKKVNDAPFTISATATSGLPVTFTSSDPSIASISGNTVTIKKAGTVTITAAQTGNGTWETAPSVTQTLSITNNQLQTQTITFGTLPAKKVGDAAFQLAATASSGLPVTYTSSNSSVASISGSTVTILKAGTVTITATQAGNDSWSQATAEQTLTITTTTGIGEEKDDLFSVYPNPTADMLYFNGEGSDNMRISIYNLLGTSVWSGMVNDKKVNVTQLPAGIYILKTSNNKETQTIRFIKQ
jgi:Leucine-rich repeat (LRR) protein